MKKISKCKWVLAWNYSGCHNAATITGMCEEHTTHCITKDCGNLATSECCWTSGFVCGYPICSKCKHVEGAGHQRHC